MRSHAQVSGVVVAVFAFLALAATPASAAYVEVGSFAGGGSGPGGSGSGDGQLSSPGQSAVNDATGNLYVADTANNRVQVFKPTATGGEYDSQAPISEPSGIAIDQSDGSVYVANATGIAKLDSSLTPVASGWTDPGVTGRLAVDPTTGDLLVADQAANLVRRFDSDGTADGTFAAERPIDLAADSSGDVLVITSTGDLINDCAASSTVRRFSGTGVDEGTIGASLSAPGALAVDPDDDSVVVASRVNQWNCGSETPLISFYASTGTETESLALPAMTQYAMVPGLAARGEGSSRVYAVTRSPYNDAFGVTRIAALEVPEPTAPEVAGQSVLLGATDATLRAKINAGGLVTGYRFEYGTTAAYGEQTEPGTLPASFQPSEITAAISGLEPGTTYHYRVVAENSIDEVQGPDRTFTTAAAASNCPNEAFRTGVSAHLTDCRAYELVTPTGSDASIRIVGGPVTPDGDAVCFATEDQLLDADPNGIKTADQGFCSWRRASGWDTKWVTGPASPTPKVYGMGGNVYFLSADGQRAVFATDGILFGNDYVPANDASHGGHMSAYMWEAGETTWLAPAGPGVGEPPEYPQELDLFGVGRRPLAATEDLTQGIFQSQRRILPEDENDRTDLYEWSPGGLRLVSTDSSGKAAGGSIGFQPTYFDGFGENTGNSAQVLAPPGTVSEDGSRIFFQHGGTPLAGDATEAPEGIDPEINTAAIPIESVYMREGDEIVLISPRRGSGPDTSAWFVGASADGEVAYLETTQQLTPEAKEAGRAIYRYEPETDELELVATAPQGVKFLTLSADGSTIFYRERMSRDLVVERDGVRTTLGTFTEADIGEEQGAGSVRGDQRMLRVSSDGRVVVFAAAGEFAGFGPGPTQVYRWEAGEGVERISAVDGSEPDANASIGAYNTVTGARSDFFHNHTSRGNSGRVISEDGSRVFFETSEALIKPDVNGATDVYEWHDGKVNLVSTGTGRNSLYHGSSADGRTVFISTFDRLLPERDRNSKRDLYAVTPGGGFAPPAPPPSCQGEACQPAQPAPPAAQARSGGGEGNLQRGLAAARLVKQGKAVRVHVLLPGRVTALLSGRIGKRKSATFSKASRVVRSSGPVLLPLKLHRKARKLLANRERMRLTLKVSHADSGQTITRKVTLHG